MVFIFENAKTSFSILICLNFPVVHRSSPQTVAQATRAVQAVVQKRSYLAKKENRH